MMDWNTLPTRREDGEERSVDDVQLVALNPISSATDGAISEAWNLVKERPFETLILSFAGLLLGNGSGAVNQISNVISFAAELGSDSSGGDEWSRMVADPLMYAASLPESALAIGVGLMFFVIVMVIAVIVWCLQTLVAGGTSIFWLRHVRGQQASLNHCTRVTAFFVPLLLTGLLQGLAIAGGFLLLIIPGVIIYLGLSLVTHVVVDKNLGYVDAIKASWRITDGHKLDLFIFFFLCGLLNLGGFLMCCVGMIGTNAITTGALAIVYDRLAEAGNAYFEHNEILSAFE